MKKSTILALFMLFAMAVTAQETVTLRFTSTTPSGSYYPFDVVNVTNVTRGWTESLTYPDTTMVLSTITGLDENFDNGGFLSEVYPNPLSGTANVMFGMKQPGIINAKVLSINGSVLSEYNDFLEAGLHQITFNLNEPQMAFLVVKTNDNQYVKKILNINYGNDNSIAINHISDEINYAKERTIGDFEIGDVMSYMAVSFYGGNMIESQGITQAQYTNETISLLFNVTSNPVPPTVTTSVVTNITNNSAVAGGNVTGDGGATITERGVCWSTLQNPTINDNHTNDGNGLGSFISNITELSANTTYYVRAYATNNVGTAYGSEVSFTTESEQIWPNGVLPGLFSVSPTQQVHFSQGNLQFHAGDTSDTWEFAENQYDYVGSGNTNLFWDRLDLFGWGTSGWYCGNGCYEPWNWDNSGSGELYGPPGPYDLTGYYANADWGVYNPISNGGNQAGLWRTLTQPEWDYVLNTRTTASGIRYAKARVNYINGVILLPDDWNSSTYSLSNTNSSGASFSSNTISASQWTTLESAGAVFLPAAGRRYGTDVSSVGSFGHYWSASNGNSYGWAAYDVNFSNSEFFWATCDFRYMGCSVRLVCPAEN